MTQLEDAISLIADLEDNLSIKNVIEVKKRMCSDLRNACGSIHRFLKSPRSMEIGALMKYSALKRIVKLINGTMYEIEYQNGEKAIDAIIEAFGNLCE